MEKRDEVTGEWRKLHNEELGGLYSLPSVIKQAAVALQAWSDPEGSRKLGSQIS